MIIVTGATGQLGSQILERLLDRLPASQIGASARDPDKASALTKRGVRVRHGDYAEPESLASAFEGASQLLIVSSNAESYGGDTLAQHRAVVEAAKSVGARRILYTSHMAADYSSAFPPARNHAATEQMLRESGIAWTALRNGFYAETLHMVLGDAATSGVVAAPEDGKVSWTVRGDLAAAAAEVLIQEGRFEGPTPPLTAGETLNIGDVATVFAALLGRPVERQIISDQDQRARMAAFGVPSSVIAITLGMYQAARAGEFAATDPTLAQLLGRKPRTVREMLVLVPEADA